MPFRIVFPRLRCLSPTSGTLSWRPGSTFVPLPSIKTRWYASRNNFGSLRVPWETHEKETVKRGIEEGLTYTEIAKLLPDRSYDAVASFVRGKNLAPPLRISWKTHEKETVMRGIAEGLTRKEIADLLPDRPYVSVTGFVRRNNLAPPSFTLWKAHELEIIMRGIAEGLSIKDIAKLLPDRSYVAMAGFAVRNQVALPFQGPWKAHETETLMRGLTEGLTYKEIADLLPNRSYSAVVTFVRRNNLAPPSKTNLWKAHETEIVMRGIAEGLPYKDITNLLPGRSYESVISFVWGRKLAPPSHTSISWKAHESEILMRGRAEGLTNKEIADLLPGRTENAVRCFSRSTIKTHERETVTRGVGEGSHIEKSPTSGRTLNTTKKEKSRLKTTDSSHSTPKAYA